MIDYSVYMMPNPSKPDVAPKAYARAQVKEVVSLDKFVKHLSEHNGVFTRGSIKGIITDRGLDVEPLRNMLAERVDEEKIRNSGVEFYLTTVSVTDKKELEIDVRDLAEGEGKDMIMASAYHPAFKQAPIGGKTYADGGFYDSVPISALVTRGYKNLIVLRLNSIGIERKVKIPEDVTVTTIAPRKDLGSMLNFSSEQSAANMVLGYYDAQKVLYGLRGDNYYIEINPRFGGGAQRPKGRTK